ncbi:hypothetical protein B0H19DRAFT_1253579 [Mycena capillaripes]|nr:hypothetical protein B0H19DRAFT_1253579 [Mycena capillaripes]
MTTLLTLCEDLLLSSTRIFSPSTMGTLTLCENLLQEIGRQAAIPEQKSLRSVLKAARHAFDPLLFAATPIVVDMGDEIETSLAQLEILATGQNVWPLVARTLRISTISGTQLTAATAVARRVEELLCPTLQSLKNIRTSTDTDEAKSIVMDFLKTIDRLEEFTLVDDSYTDAHYALLDVESSNLHRLSVTAKTRIALDGSFSRRWPAAFHWTGMIVRKSPHLEQLVLPTSYAWSEMCPILQSTDIYLKQISGACVTQELLAYLASYFGLERLKIQSAAGKEALAYPFFDTLLSHKHSLLSLQCPAYYEGEWCLKPYNLAIISQLHALQHLEMNVNSYDIGSNSNIIVSGNVFCSTPFAL